LEADICAKCQLRPRGNLKARLLVELDELRRQNLEDSLRLVSTNQELKNIKIDLEASRSETNEERVSRIELQNQLVRVKGELGLLRAKFEAEERAEADAERRRLGSQLARAEETVEELAARCESLEAGKQRLQATVEELQAEVDEANRRVVSMERKQRGWERIVGEWRARCAEAALELEKREVAWRAGESELAKVREQGGEVAAAVEELRRENGRLGALAGELMEEKEVAEKARYEVEKRGRRAEVEREEVEACLRDVRAVGEQDRAALAAMQAEMAALRLKIDAMLGEKEEEFEGLRYFLSFQK